MQLTTRDAVPEPYLVSSLPPNAPLSATPVSHGVDGAFEGSFAGTARDITVLHTRPWYRRQEYYLEGWSDPVIWRAAVDECLATAGFIYLSGQFGMTLMNEGVTQTAAYVGIFNSVSLALFIYATAAATGGHLNPMITFTTVLCGLTPMPRGVVLITAQVLGGILAGGVLLGSWGHDRAVSHMGGGSFFDPSHITPSQVLVTETMSSLIFLFLSIGTGLDPRQQVLYGRQLGPLLVGLSLGLVTCATTGIAPGYTGACINPARAIGLAIAGWNWHDHWIWWSGPALGSMLVSLTYRFAPPSHAERVKYGRTEAGQPVAVRAGRDQNRPHEASV
ncbi:aquaporin-like protein [Chaetomidium leptoderma]|uniref:Aquaporin-like protein n=1 Tax=Chaetomidium leptoderma TaxID=669021 RepID=A0AAN6VVX7_9PEZI|nr:aquaporin-like protein [Chaetomidium leptoderma]